MPIIKKKDFVQDDILKGLNKELDDTNKKVIKLTESNKKLAESLNLIKKSSDGTEARKLIEATDKLKKSTLELTSVQKERIRLSNERKKVLAKLITVDNKQNEVLERGKAQLRDKNKLLKANATLNNKLAGTEEKLLALNVKARLERKKLNTETKKGQTRLKELNAEIDRNNTKIKRNADALKKQKIGIGQYGQALKGLGAKLVGAFAAVQGLRGAFNVLTNVIGSTAEGQLFLAKVTGATNAVLAVLRDRLIDGWKAMTDFSSGVEDHRSVFEKLGDWYTEFYTVRAKGVLNIFKGIGSYLKGDFKEGIEGVNDGFVQVATGTENATKKTKELITQLRILADFGAAIAGAEKQLELDRSRAAIRQAKDIRTIADLRVKAADKAKFTGKEREQFILRALSLTRKLGAENVKFAERELALQQAVFNSANSNIDDEIELNKLKKKANEVAAASLKKQKLLTAELQTAKNEAAKEEIANNKKIDTSLVSAGGIDSPILKLKEVEVSFTDFHKAENDKRLADDKETNAQRLSAAKANERAIADVRASVADAAFAAGQQIASDLFGAAQDERLNKIAEANEREKTENESKAESEQEILRQQLENGLITETQFKEKSAQIDEDLRKKNAKIDLKFRREQAKADKKKALFDIGVATAVAVIRQLSTTPFPFAIPFLAAIASIAALQTAVVLAKPLPTFGKGGEIEGESHDQGGVNINAEGGEYMIRKSGYKGAEGLADMMNKGLIKDSDIGLLKNQSNYSPTILQLNGLSDIQKNTRQTNEYLKHMYSSHENNGMIHKTNAYGKETSTNKINRDANTL